MGTTKKWLANLFILIWVLMLVGIAGIRWEFLPLQVGLLGASLGAAIVFLYGILLLPVVLYKLVFRKPLSSGVLSICIAGLLPAVILLVTVEPRGFNSPAIHDVTTDTANPPELVLAAAQRTGTDNPVEYEGDVIARLQQEAYPDIEPLFTDQHPDKVLDTAEQVVRARGWTLLGTRESDEPGVAGVVEAVARSAVFRFEDDVAIRVSREGLRTRVDMRSASRVGLGDLGANANRIRELRKSLEEKF